MSNWITEPIEMSLADAMAATLMADTLIRTQDGTVFRKIYGKNRFEHLTNRMTGKPLARAKRWLKPVVVVSVLCGDCGETIDTAQEHVSQDRTGNRFCSQCADNHIDVTTVAAAI